MGIFIVDDAIAYCRMGFTVIPISPEYDEEEQKFLKRPYIRWAEYQTRQSTEEEIREWWAKWPGAMIGIITGEKVSAVDCDSQEAYDHIQTLLPETFETPIALTPRGGYHLWFQPNGSKLHNLTSFLPKTDFRGVGGYIIAPPSLNSKGGKYQWIDGLEIGKVSPQAIPQDLSLKLKDNNKYLRGGVIGGEILSPDSSMLTNANIANIILQEGRRDEDLFEIGMALIDGRYRKESIIQVLRILAKNANPPFPEKELEVKLRSIFDRHQRKQRNIADEIKEWVMLTSGDFLLTDAHKDLLLLTREDKQAAYMAIKRLQSPYLDPPLIEKSGTRNGQYRLVPKMEDSSMDLLTESELEEVNVKLPIDLNEMCILSPGNIIIIAGSKSSGKTAMLMNLAWDNQDRFDVTYLNSEMSPTEMKKRLKKFAPLNKWHIKGVKCHNDFDRYITGERGKMFIVDYLEIHDKFYEVAGFIRKIHEKLGDAICFIALQMKGGAELARGGEFSAEKSRLYLTMDYRPEEKHTMVRIYDAKEPRPPFDNVRGKFRRVKIIDGHKLSALGTGWTW